MTGGIHRVRARRAEAQRVAAQRRRRRKLIVGGVVGAIVAAIAIALITTAARDASRSGQPIEGVISVGVAQRSHVSGPVNYPQTPPLGGNHAGVWQNCGYYDAPIVKENGIHSLEHGAVWVTYRPDLPVPEVDALRQLTRGQTFVLVSPYPELQAPVVVSAWGRQLRLERAGDPRLDAFIRAFRVGPQTPEPGAPCTGGVGTPK